MFRVSTRLLVLLSTVVALTGSSLASAHVVAGESSLPPIGVLGIGAKVGYLGCSQTTGAAKGYHEIGGQRLWETIEYPGGAISRWADPATNGPLWAAFDAAWRAHPATTVWWQLCVIKGNADTNYNDARTVLLLLRQHTAFLAQIHVSAQNGYVAPHVCDIGPPNGPDIAQEVANRLVLNGLLPGPAMSDLRGPDSAGAGPNELVDSCHPNQLGRAKLGANLRAFFG